MDSERGGQSEGKQATSQIPAIPGNRIPRLLAPVALILLGISLLLIRYLFAESIVDLGVVGIGLVVAGALMLIIEEIRNGPTI
jgi:hypothetical protein